MPIARWTCCLKGAPPEHDSYVDIARQGLRDTKQQVALDVWSCFQTLRADTENRHNTAAVVQSARHALDAIQHRYQSGVGNILEVLGIQSTLATAEQQQIQSQLDWRTARLELAASLGQLGMWAL